MTALTIFIPPAMRPWTSPVFHCASKPTRQLRWSVGPGGYTDVVLEGADDRRIAVDRNAMPEAVRHSQIEPPLWRHVQEFIETRGLGLDHLLDAAGVLALETRAESAERV